jgi:hypothetical protein
MYAGAALREKTNRQVAENAANKNFILGGDWF